MMRNRMLLVIVLLIGTLAAAGMARRSVTARPAGLVPWDYGILRVDRLTWRERGRIVEQKPGPDFAAAMGVPYSNQSNVFEITLLNGLGDQGWELVSVSGGTTYVFKRTR